MKRFFVTLVIGSCLTMLMLIGLPFSSPATASPAQAIEDIGLCADTGQKLDLNNANLMAFTDCPGFYPNLASAILAHGPYETVEDVLSIPDLTSQQKALLKANLDAFTITNPVVPLEMRMPPRINQPAH